MSIMFEFYDSMQVYSFGYFQPFLSVCNNRLLAKKIEKHIVHYQLRGDDEDHRGEVQKRSKDNIGPWFSARQT